MRDSYQKIINKPQALIYFWAPWCGPCRTTTPIINELEREFEDISFLKVNTDEEQEFVSELNISSVPLFMYFEKGILIDEIKGSANKQQLKKMIDKNKNS